MSDSNEAAKQATPHALLLAELLDSRIPKSEREHAAKREIERLTAERDELRRQLAEAEQSRALRPYLISKATLAMEASFDAGWWYGRKPGADETTQALDRRDRASSALFDAIDAAMELTRPAEES